MFVCFDIVLVLRVYPKEIVWGRSEVRAVTYAVMLLESVLNKLHVPCDRTG